MNIIVMMLLLVKPSCAGGRDARIFAAPASLDAALTEREEVD